MGVDAAKIAVAGMGRVRTEVIDREKEISQQVLEKKQAAEEARLSNDEIDRQYSEVKEKRRKKFMACFDVVNEKLDMVYKDLTSTDELEGYYSLLFIFVDSVSVDSVNRRTLRAVHHRDYATA